MATNTRHIPASPEAVWTVLADPDEYGHWVVGSQRIRAADAAFPAAGARFHHAVGIGPLHICDHTEVIAAEPPFLLRLRAKARPLGTATVIIQLLQDGAGTTVRLFERPDGLYAPLALNPLVQVLTKLRNVESLRRLEARVVARAGVLTSTAPIQHHRQGSRTLRVAVASRMRRTASDIDATPKPMPRWDACSRIESRVPKAGRVDERHVAEVEDQRADARHLENSIHLGLQLERRGHVELAGQRDVDRRIADRRPQRET